MSHLTPVPSDPEQLRVWLEQQGPSRLDSVIASLLDDSNPEIDLPPPPREVGSLTVKVTLKDTSPPVWRRLVVPGDITLDDLHDVLQTAMGWSDSHLHRFFPGASPDGPYFVTEYDVEEGDEGTPEEAARLDQLLRATGDRIRYEYDFGDGWKHEIRLESVGPLGEEPRPRCTGGRRACPPEDVGGVGGYDEVAAWVRAGRPADGVPVQFESLEHAVRWLPVDWHPDHFDVEDTDLQLRALAASGELLLSLRPAALAVLTRLSPVQMARVSEWLTEAVRTTLQPKDLEEVTEPYRRLLAVIGGGVELTGSGYLPPSVVEELCPALGVDPILAGKANREANVRPLAAFRKVARQVGLLHTSGGLLMPTVAGIRLGDDPQGLWRHVAARLPVGRAELKRDVGWFTLLAVAGGVPHNDVYDAVHELCVGAGWMDEDGTPIERWSVIPLVWPTLAALVGARWNAREPWPGWVPAAAATVVFSDRLD